MKRSLFLSLYLLIAISESLVVQTLMLGSHGGALGASGVIFGLMIISCFVAPGNEIQWFGMVFYRGFTFQTPVLIAVLYYFLVDFGMALFLKMHMSTPVLHVLGGASGFAWGLIAYRLNWFQQDSESLFARISDLSGNSRKEPKCDSPKTNANTIANPKSLPKPKFGKLDLQRKKLDGYLARGNYGMALMKLEQIRHDFSSFRLSQKQLIQLINSGSQKSDWTNVLTWMGLYTNQYSSHGNEILLRKAMIECLKLRQPNRARKTLTQIETTELSEEQLLRYRKLQRSLGEAASRVSET